MSEEMAKEIAEVLETVKDAQSQGKFNLAEVVKGRGYPQDTVEIYTDVESAYELSKINDKLIRLTDLEESKELEAQAEIFKKKVMDSRLKFYMRGIDQRHVENIEEKSRNKNDLESEQWIVDYMCELVAANIIKVEDAQGNVDEKVFTGDDIDAIRGVLSTEAWEQIVSTMQKLTLATGYFKGLTDAGFLQKS